MKYCYVSCAVRTIYMMHCSANFIRRTKMIRTSTTTMIKENECCIGKCRTVKVDVPFTSSSYGTIYCDDATCKNCSEAANIIYDSVIIIWKLNMAFQHIKIRDAEMKSNIIVSLVFAPPLSPSPSHDDDGS